MPNLLTVTEAPATRTKKANQVIREAGVVRGRAARLRVAQAGGADAVGVRGYSVDEFLADVMFVEASLSFDRHRMTELLELHREGFDAGLWDEE